jgi:hypothetical protein
MSLTDKLHDKRLEEHHCGRLTCFAQEWLSSSAVGHGTLLIYTWVGKRNDMRLAAWAVSQVSWVCEPLFFMFIGWCCSYVFLCPT